MAHKSQRSKNELYLDFRSSEILLWKPNTFSIHLLHQDAVILNDKDLNYILMLTKSFENVDVLLPTAQWFPRGYILPTAAAGPSVQSNRYGNVARKRKTVHTGLQVHVEYMHTPPMLSEENVKSK